MTVKGLHGKKVVSTALANSSLIENNLVNSMLI